MTACRDGRDVRPISFALMSTAAAAFSWLALVIVGRVQGPTVFATTSAIWGLYFGAAGLLFGYQQEVTRRVATRLPTSEAPGRGYRLLPRVALVVTVVAFCAALKVLPGSGGAWLAGAACLAVGCGAYSVLSCLNGALAANSRWNLLGFIVIADSVIRLSLLLLVALFSMPAWSIAVAVASGALIWLPLMASTRARSALAKGSHISGLGTRVLLAMAVSGCSALLAVGFPTLVVALGKEVVDDATGSALALISVLRAPLVVAAGPLAVLSMSTATRSFAWRAILKPLTYAVSATILSGAAVAMYFWGPFLVKLVFTPSFVADKSLAAAAFVSSLLFVALFMSGTVLMAQDRHFASLAGWATAVLTTLSALALPIARELRLGIALTLPLVLGIAVHLCWKRVPGLR